MQDVPQIPVTPPEPNFGFPTTAPTSIVVLPGWLDNEVMRQITLGWARQLIALVGGAFIAKGWLTTEQFDSVSATYSAELGGLILAVVAFAWSAAHKRESITQTRSAITLPMSTATRYGDVKYRVKQLRTQYPQGVTIEQLQKEKMTNPPFYQPWEGAL